MRMAHSIIFAACAALLAAGGAAAQDYEREARWKAEVLGNLVVGDAVEIAPPGGRAFLGLYTPGSKAAVLLVHGIGVHPDHGVIGSLRVALSDLGFATLSIQMPVLDVCGERDNPAVLESAPARRATRQAIIRGADHFYAGKEDELARVLREFIDSL
jgi:hypothetical protein